MKKVLFVVCAVLLSSCAGTRVMVYTPMAPEPVGPYNQAVCVGSMVYTAGQIAIDPSTGSVVSGGITEQTTQVLTNLEQVLVAAGSSLDKVVKVTIYLKDLNDFADMNAVYATFFQEETAPARSTVEAARIPKDVLVEIDVIATR